MTMLAPLSDAVIVAVSEMVDDRDSPRDPSHSDIQFQIDRVGLQAGDPGRQPTPVGKKKRVRGVLSYALEYDEAGGRKLVGQLVAVIRANGGFREDSPNFVGADAIANARSVFDSEGFVLTSDGDLRRKTLET